MLWDARHLREKKISEKLFGENDHKPPDCATNETSDTDVYLCPPRKQNNKKPSCNPLLLFLSSFIRSPSFLHHLSPVYVIWWFCYCMCILKWLTWSDLHYCCRRLKDGMPVLLSGTAHIVTDTADFDTLWYYPIVLFDLPLTLVEKLPKHNLILTKTDKYKPLYYALFIECISEIIENTYHWGWAL